jgi:pilus assembly protein CpaC
MIRWNVVCRGAILTMGALMVPCVAWAQDRTVAGSSPKLPPPDAAVGATARLPAFAPDGGSAEESLAPKRQAKRAMQVRTDPYAPIRKPADEGQITEIDMFVGESRVFPTPGLARIAVGNGSILEATPLDNRDVLLFANQKGTSSLFIWNSDGRYQRVKINIVAADTSKVAREIVAFLAPIPNARASVIGDKVIVEGDDLNDSDLLRIKMMSQQYPQLVNFTNRQGFEQMVMIDVKVLEFPMQDLRELGVKWGTTGGGAVGGVWSPISRGNGAYQINQSTTGGEPPISGVGGGPFILPRGLNILSVLNLGLNASVAALAQEGKTTILAEPRLSTRNGSKASFHAGGAIPYGTVSANGTNVQFRNYGIKLDIEPKVDRNGNIRATIQTEVSSIDGSVSTPFGPALLSRGTDTEFNVRAGETIVLSGLIQRETSTTIDKLPGLGDIPILGALFRSKRFLNRETELVILVTPTIVDARSPGVAETVSKAKERLEDRLGPKPYLVDPLRPGADVSRPDLAASATSDEVAAPAQTRSETRSAEPGGTPTIVPQAAVAATPFDQPKGSTLRITRNVVMRAAPGARAEELLLLGEGSIVTLRSSAQGGAPSTWTPASVGEVQGWVESSALEPSKLDVDVKAYTASRQGVALPTLAKPIPAAALTLSGKSTTGQYAVLADQLSLRIVPDINASVLFSLGKGQIVRGLDVAPRGAWVAVDVDGHRGWVAAQWLQPVLTPVPAAASTSK